MMPLESKVAIVTGAGRGIGKATALALARNGARVVVCARTQTEIDGVAQEIQRTGREAFAFRADISKEDDVRSVIDRALERFRTVDILINNAGIGAFAKVSDLSTKDFDRMWEVNMRGVFLCSRAVLPYMIKQKSGDIINISSLAGRNAFIGGAGYCSTKWALMGFARCLMLEVREYQIRVITLCPGSVETEFGNHSTGSPRSNGAIPKAADIGQVIIDALSAPRNVMVSEIDIRPTNPNR